MMRVLRRYRLWLVYVVFLALAARFGAREGFVASDSSYVTGKYLVLVVFLLFLAYSLHATRKENFFRSIGVINRLYWGRQVGIDLYISVALSLALIYLVEGSAAVLLVWAGPVLIFANLAILPFILLNYNEIVGHFLP
jgi:hypothetical protein